VVVTVFLAIAGALAVYAKYQTDRMNLPAGATRPAPADNGGPAPSATAPAAPLELLAEDVTTVTRQTLTRELQVTGTLRAVVQAGVKARVAGEIRELRVREGESVKAGQLLAQIDPTELGLRVRQAGENVAAARGQLDIARKNRDNNRSLFERGFISATALQNTEAQLATAQANVDANLAALDLARKALADAEVRAPIDGIVATRLVQPGERVALDARLLDIVDLRQLEFEASVPATSIGQVKVGQAVRITPEGQATPLAGKVVRINPSNLSGSRSYLIYAQLANPGQSLRAGLFAEGAVVLETRANVVAAPVAALRPGAAGTTVLVIDAGQLAERAVTTGLVTAPSGGLIEIRSGLEAGDQVVHGNLGKLRPGTAVKVVTPAGPGPAAAAAATPTQAPRR